jgi:hypothetical protein
MRSLADANAIPARAAPCVIFAASTTNRNRCRSTRSKRMEVFMRSSRLRHCLRQCSTPRPSPDNPAFAAHDLYVGSADACSGAGGPIPASSSAEVCAPCRLCRIGGASTSTIGRRPGRAPTTCAHRGGRRHCKIAPIGQQHSPRRGCSARRRFASPRVSRGFSGRGFLR